MALKVSSKIGEPSVPVGSVQATVGASGIDAHRLAGAGAACVARGVLLRRGRGQGEVAVVGRGDGLRLDRVQPATLTEVLPAAAVKLRVPSLSTAPTGTRADHQRLQGVAVAAGPLTVALRVPSAIGEPSVPLTEPPDHDTAGAGGLVAGQIARVALPVALSPEGSVTV